MIFSRLKLKCNKGHYTPFCERIKRLWMIVIITNFIETSLFIEHQKEVTHIRQFLYEFR
jgi:hypothetical protein